MECRRCGTEIADNALICYRCGEATSERERPSPAARPPRRLWSPILLGVVLVLALGFFANLAAAGQTVSPAVWLMLAVAGVLLAWRLRQ